ncbi:hypothetical protein CLOP_g23320 [Closterium sp. NIES-67]|nr:hypothetical protein CLOP_g23320 [Closterium sp. NIES-67]
MALDNGPASSGDAREVVAELRQRLLDRALPIEQRIRALFSLRNLKGDTPQQALIEAMEDKSVLLAHEAAFALGQMGDVFSVPALTRVLEDPRSRGSRRHRRGLLPPSAPNISCRPCTRGSGDVRAGSSAATGHPSCGRGRERGGAEGGGGNRRGKGGGGGEGEGKRFMSVDPAGSAPKNASTEELRKLLLQEDANMYDRYGALFALRDKAAATSNAGDAAAGAGGGGDSGGAGAAGAGGGGDSGGAGAAGAGGGGDSGGAGGSSGASFASEAVTAIVEALETCTSALLRHEIAYVLGQLQNKTAAQALVRALQDTSCHAMVRHEAAVALGSVADPLTLQLLREFQKDPDPIVAESCDVALDLMRFELQPDAFQYADLLE